MLSPLAQDRLRPRSAALIGVHAKHRGEPLARPRASREIRELGQAALAAHAERASPE